MVVEFNIENLQKQLSLFPCILDASASVYDTDYNRVALVGEPADSDTQRKFLHEIREESPLLTYYPNDTAIAIAPIHIHDYTVAYVAVDGFRLDGHPSKEDSVPVYKEEDLKSSLTILSSIVALNAKVFASNDEEYLQYVIKFVHAHLGEKLTASDFCKRLKVERAELDRRFFPVYHETFSAYLRNERIEAAKRLITETDLDIVKIAEKTGFSSFSYFKTAFEKKTGVPPLAFRKNV